MNSVFTIYFNKKLLKTLTLKQKIIFSKILILMIIGSLLELIGIGLIIPIVSILTDHELSSNFLVIKNFINDIFNFFLIELTINNLLIFVIIFFFIKSLFLSNLAYVQGKFVYQSESSISKKIFQNYLNQPYLFFIKNNSAKLIQNVVNEPALFNGFGMQSTMTLITELMFLIIIVFFLFTILPFETIFVLIILLSFVILWTKIFKNKIQLWGLLRQNNFGKSMQCIQQGISAIKEVKVFGKENFFFEKYQTFNDAVINNNIKATTLVQIPRLWLDFMAILLILLILLFTLNFQNLESVKEILPIAALYLVASIRIIPSINRILYSFQQLAYADSSINRVFEEINLINEIPVKISSSIKLKKKICIKDLTFSYDNNKEIIKKCNIEIKRGEFISITGQSGSGKTTLLNLIIGLLKPTSGFVEVDDINIHENIKSWWSQIGYISQNTYLLDDTVLSNIAFGEDENMIDIEKAWSVIRKCALEKLINNLPDGIMTNVGERGLKLSGGQIQRLGIARCLYFGADILFLDEATNALDTNTEQEILNTIEDLRGKVTIFNIAHNPAITKNYDRRLKVTNDGLVEEV